MDRDLFLTLMSKGEEVVLIKEVEEEEKDLEVTITSISQLLLLWEWCREWITKFNNPRVSSLKISEIKYSLERRLRLKT